MTTEELDALDALLREQYKADEALRSAEVEYALATTPYGKERAMAKRGMAALAVVESQSAMGRAAGAALHRILAAARQAETLRAKLDETEQARHEARYYANEVAAERDNLQSRLNQAEHAAKMLTAERDASEKALLLVTEEARTATLERDKAKAESHTRLLQRLDAEKEVRYCRALVDGKAEERTQAAELQARQANDRVRVMTDALKETEAERDALKAQRDELRDAAIALAVWHGPSCDCNYGEYCTDHRFDDSTGCEACSMDERLQRALEAAR